MSAVKNTLIKKLLKLIKDLLEKIKEIDQKVNCTNKDKAQISFYLLLIDTIISDIQKLNEGSADQELLNARYLVFSDAANSCNTVHKGLQPLEEKP